MSELHNLFGERGAGKSAFLMNVVSDIYFNRGQELLENSRRIIEEQNKKRTKKLTPPSKVPIYCINFKCKIPNPDGSIYEPFYLEGSELGIGKKYKKIYPGAVIIIDEAQNELNSKSDLKREVSAFFEKSRHADFEIWIASQRPILINKDIRDLSHHFIQICKLEMDVAQFDIICGLKWYCREFNSRADVDEYADLPKSEQDANVNYRETVYTGAGEITEYYDSKGLLEEYLPAEGEDYEK